MRDIIRFRKVVVMWFRRIDRGDVKIEDVLRVLSQLLRASKSRVARSQAALAP
jgi:hypothetical protein